jgi:hypothetical protein
LRTAGASNLRDSIYRITIAKWTESVAQVVKHLLCEHLLCKDKALSLNPSGIKVTDFSVVVAYACDPRTWEDWKFEDSLGYIARPCLKNKIIAKCGTIFNFCRVIVYIQLFILIFT